MDHHKNEWNILLCIYKNVVLILKVGTYYCIEIMILTGNRFETTIVNTKNNLKNAHTIFMLKLCKYSTSDF